MPPFNPPIFDAIAAYGIGGLAVVVALIFTALIVARKRRSLQFGMLASVAGIMALSGVLAATGLLSDTDAPFPPMGLMIVLVLVLSVRGGLGPLGSHMVAEVPLVALIGLQMFRLPLELVMHHAANVGIMPEALSYSGYNFDIATGIGAVLLFTALKLGVNVPAIVIWLWNLWGIYCLVAITIIAIATSPMVHALGTDPRNMNTWVLYFPYVWLPVVMVTIALISHIVITRIILRRTPSVDNSLVRT